MVNKGEAGGPRWCSSLFHVTFLETQMHGFYQCNFSHDFGSQGVALSMGNGEHCIPFLAPQWTLDRTQGTPKNTPSHFWEVL